MQTTVEERGRAQRTVRPRPEKLNGAAALLYALELEGVEIVFGHPGGAIMPTYDALYDSPIKHVLVRHEQAGAHAADAFYRASGRVGVCFATSGPGATNLVTGLATAHMDSSAVVAVTGNVPSALIGTDAFQEADVYGITLPITKHNYLVKHVNDIPRVVREAFHIASTGRPGPVLIDVPKDVQQADFTGTFETGELDLPGYRPTAVGHAGQIKRAAEAIRSAERPVMMVGGGGQAAASEIAAFAERTGVPVITTLMGLGAYPAGADNALGMPGMHGTVTANRAITHCDLIIGAGLRFDDRVTGNIKRFAPNATVVHIDIDPAEISKLVRAHVPVVGDLRDVLPRLGGMLERLAIPEWWTQLSEWKGKYPERYKKDKPLVSQEVIQLFQRATGGDCVVTTEVGQHQMFAARLFATNEPRSFITSGGLGTMGFGLPAAIGAAFARPDKQVVCIAGDGSVQMNIQELAEEVGLGFFGKGRLEHPAARPADSLGVGEAALFGRPGRVLMHRDQARHAAAFGVGAADEVAGAFGRDHQYVDVGRRLNLAEVDVEAVGEKEGVVGLQVRLDLLAVDFALRLVRQQNHDEVARLRRFRNLHHG